MLSKLIKFFTNSHPTPAPQYWQCRCGRFHDFKDQFIYILAIRHGESQHNTAGVINGDPTKPYYLTQRGIDQAEKLAKELKDRPIMAIIASEMIRTQQTAAPLAKLKHLEMVIDARLNDINPRGLEGVNINDFRRLTKNAKISIQGSETNKDVGIRLKSFLEDLICCYSGKHIAIVSSEIILHSLKQVSQGLPCDEDKDEHIQNGVAYDFTIKTPICCPSCGDSCPVQSNTKN